MQEAAAQAFASFSRCPQSPLLFQRKKQNKQTNKRRRRKKKGFSLSLCVGITAVLNDRFTSDTPVLVSSNQKAAGDGQRPATCP